MLKRSISILSLSAILAGCGMFGGGDDFYTSQRAPGPRGGETVKIGKPYKINGVWYTPQADPDYDEVGMSSWYGKQFHGKKTANGEIFDMNQLTAAHRTLPLPSYVRVTNLSNGRSLVLRVNDRGPFAKDRILDVSRRAAQLLGFERKGVQRVRVQIVNPDGTPVRRERTTTRVADASANAGATMPGMLYVQVGAFAERRNAHALVDVLGDAKQVFVQEISVDGRQLYRVRVGPFSSVNAAESALSLIHDAGYREARIFTEPTG